MSPYKIIMYQLLVFTIVISCLTNTIEILNLKTEQDLTQSNSYCYKKYFKACVKINNKTQETRGSGVIVKLNNNYYVLTCAHLIEDKNFVIVAYYNEDNWKEIPLKCIKLDQNKDLALLSITDNNKHPFIEIGWQEPQIGDKLLLIGNPAGFDDVITEGILCKKGKDFYLVSNIMYYGSSGCPIIYKGKIVGIIEAIYWFSLKEKTPTAAMGFGSTLLELRKFLKEFEQ